MPEMRAWRLGQGLLAQAMGKLFCLRRCRRVARSRRPKRFGMGANRRRETILVLFSWLILLFWPQDLQDSMESKQSQSAAPPDLRASDPGWPSLGAIVSTRAGCFGAGGEIRLREAPARERRRMGRNLIRRSGQAMRCFCEPGRKSKQTGGNFFPPPGATIRKRFAALFPLAHGADGPAGSSRPKAPRQYCGKVCKKRRFQKSAVKS